MKRLILILSFITTINFALPEPSTIVTPRQHKEIIKALSPEELEEYNFIISYRGDDKEIIRRRKAELNKFLNKNKIKGVNV